MWLKFKENHWNVINTQDGGCPWRQGVGGTTEKWHQGGARGGSKGLRHVLFLKLSIWCSDQPSYFSLCRTNVILIWYESNFS